MYRPSAMSILLLLVFSAYAWPQTETATVLGTVTDPSGAVVPGAQVTILNQSTGLKRDCFADSTGQYHIAGLPMGTYSIRVQKNKFQTQVREEITLTSASSLTIKFSLSVGTQQVQLTVNGDINGIDSTTSTVSGLVAERSLTKLPLNNQDHCCPATSRTDSISCKYRLSRYRSRGSEVLVKWGFSRIASG